MDNTWCVVGAGYAGIAAARGLRAAGLEVEVLDAGAGPGGNWRDGVYDSTTLITSRDTTAFPGLPFPVGTPVFPTRTDMAAYLDGVARSTGVAALVRTGVEVRHVAPDDGGWHVATSVGDRRYAGVVLATGHHRAPFTPVLAGTFAGRTLHSRDYRRPGDVTGRVLVVGAGNSAADIALEVARAGHLVDLAVKVGPHVVPKAIFGRPTVELTPPRVPERLAEAGFGLLLRALQGRSTSVGLPRPQGRLFVVPVLHSGLLPALRGGLVGVRPGPAAFDDGDVVFDGGTRGRYETIVWATGYRTTFDMLDRTLLDGGATAEGEVPRLPLGSVALAPGLLTLGLRQVRTGQGRYLAAAGDFLGEWARIEAAAGVPLGALLARFVGVSQAPVVPERAALRDLDRARASLPSILRLAGTGRHETGARALLAA